MLKWAPAAIAAAQPPPTPPETLLPAVPWFGGGERLIAGTSNPSITTAERAAFVMTPDCAETRTSPDHFPALGSNRAPVARTIRRPWRRSRSSLVFGAGFGVAYSGFDSSRPARSANAMGHNRRPSKQMLRLIGAMSARARDWRYGYDLMKETGLLSGTLYPLLMRMADQGLVEAEWRGSDRLGRPPRHVYRLTTDGIAFARTVLSRDAGNAAELALTRICSGFCVILGQLGPSRWVDRPPGSGAGLTS